ncbi:MAG: DegT/DnrJ/EryC1/StrS family aminotransferase [Gammaproteobacteria bacterium]|nr:DegT/DnrJ/EryC1/StrS family aminotransferase [Gammaproteobacteria bacterium]
MQFIDLKTQYQRVKVGVDARIAGVLNHGQYIMGPEVAEMEQALGAYTGAAHCIAVASGTEALLISLMALDVGPGDEVITSPFTFVATAEVIALLGATPVFVDIQADTYNIDPALIEAAISPRTRVIMPVSLYGQVADMEEINAIATRHGLTVIEDGCQSFGAEYRGRKSCGLSAVGATSFFPSKPLGCYGDGGAIFTSDDQLARAMREIRVHGQEKRYYHTRIGVGGRMDTLQCAVVLAKLERFNDEIAARIRIGARYHEKLANIPGIGLTALRADRTSVHAQYTVAVEDRDDFLAKLKAAGVPSAVHYPVPLHQQPAYADRCVAANLDQAEWAAAHVVSLPMHPYMDDATQDRVVSAVVAAVA